VLLDIGIGLDIDIELNGGMESFDEVLFVKVDLDANFLRPITLAFGPFPRFDWNEEVLGERGTVLEGLSLRAGIIID